MEATVFQKAFKVFCRTLRRDKGLYQAYEANIAMAFVDEGHRQGSRDSYRKRHAVANQAAKNFLDLLIAPTKKESG